MLRAAEAAGSARWARETRLTVDVEIGSYDRFSSLIGSVNRVTPKGEPRLTRTKVLRSIMGSWMSMKQGELESPLPAGRRTTPKRLRP